MKPPAKRYVSKAQKSSAAAADDRPAPKSFIVPRDKREELKTYRELAMGRQMKSARQRRRVDRAGKMRVIGDGSADRPHLAVPAARYREVRLEQQRRLLMEAREQKLNLPADRLLAQLTPRVERLTYAQLAEEARQETARHIPVAALGRALTKEEQACFAATHALDRKPSETGTAHTALQEALSQVERRQTHNPARYQAIWAQLVGNDAAAQSHLHRIDAATQTAWIRCTNSVLSADLQRRRGLAAQLAKALGVPIRQLRASF
jgi:hypothetical protein